MAKRDDLQLDMTTEELIFLVDTDEQMSAIVRHYDLITFFEGLIGLAYLNNDRFSHYAYFIDRIYKDERISRYIFLTLSRAFEQNAYKKIEEDKLNQFPQFLYDILLYVKSMKSENTPPDIIIRKMKRVSKNFKVCYEIINTADIEKIRENAEKYVEMLLLMLKYSLVVYLRWMTNDLIFYPRSREEDKLDKFLNTMNEIYTFISFSKDFRILSINKEDYLKVKAETKKKYISTGLKYLDVLFKDHPGYKKGWLLVVGGAYGLGKTKFLICMATNAIKQGYKVLHITAENDEDEVMEDYISAYIGREFKYENDSDLFDKVSNEISDKIKIIKVRPLDFTCSNVRTFIDIVKSKGFEPDVLVVDSINLMTVEGKNGMSKYDKGEKIMEGLFDIAKGYDIAVWTCAQLQRQGVKKSQDNEEIEAKSEDVSMSYAIPSFAHVYITLNQTHDELKNSVMRVYVDKIRRGISKITVPVYFDKGNMILRDAKEDEIDNYFGDKTQQQYYNIIKRRIDKIKVDIPIMETYSFEEKSNNVDHEYNNINKEDTEMGTTIDEAIDKAVENMDAKTTDNEILFTDGTEIEKSEVKKSVLSMIDAVINENSTVPEVKIYPYKDKISFYEVKEGNDVIEAGLKLENGKHYLIFLKDGNPTFYSEYENDTPIFNEWNYEKIKEYVDDLIKKMNVYEKDNNNVENGDNESNKDDKAPDKKKNGTSKYNLFHDLDNIDMLAIVHHCYTNKKGELVTGFGVMKGFSKMTKGRINRYIGKMINENGIDIHKFTYKHNDKDIDLYFIPGQDKELKIEGELEEYKDKILEFAYEKYIENGEKPKIVPGFYLKINEDVLKLYLAKLLKIIPKYENVVIVYDRTYRQHFSLKEFVGLLYKAGYMKCADKVWIANGKKILLKELFNKYGYTVDNEKKKHVINNIRNNDKIYPEIAKVIEIKDKVKWFYDVSLDELDRIANEVYMTDDFTGFTKGIILSLYNITNNRLMDLKKQINEIVDRKVKLIKIFETTNFGGYTSNFLADNINIFELKSDTLKSKLFFIREIKNKDISGFYIMDFDGNVYKVNIVNTSEAKNYADRLINSILKN